MIINSRSSLENPAEPEPDRTARVVCVGACLKKCQSPRVATSFLKTDLNLFSSSGARAQGIRVQSMRVSQGIV